MWLMREFLAVIHAEVIAVLFMNEIKELIHTLLDGILAPLG